MAKTAKVSTRIEAEVMAVLEHAAAAERRPIAALLRLIVEDWVATRQSSEEDEVAF